MRLAAGAALAPLLALAAATAARAQIDPPSEMGPTPPPAATEMRQRAAALPGQPPVSAPLVRQLGEDGLGPGGFYLEAQTLVRDDDRRRITARGDVEARYNGRVVRAQELIYEQATGVVVARGKARVINADGSVQNADEITLDEDLRAGVAYGFSTQLQQNVTIAAATAVRRNEQVSELRKAIFTPCDICAADGSNKSPTFSLQASRVVQDRKRRLIYYQNAVIRVKGVPVFYLPAFSHPDPTAERASGLLIPRVSQSDRRGFSYEQPYLWVISPSQDLVISPQINSKVNPLLNTEYRKRFYSGEVNVRAGYTYEQDFDGDGDKFGEETSRSYVLARGDFDISSTWTWGFAAERTSDDLLFDKYKVRDVYEPRGLFAADQRRLLSQVYTQRQDQRSYLSVSALSFQTLRFGEDQGVIPVVGPLVEGRFAPAESIAGGRLTLTGSAVALFRDEAIGAPQRAGVDSRRITGEAEWRRDFFFRGSGVRVTPFVMARGDGYSIADLSDGTATGTRSRTLARGNATVGADIAMPFVGRVGSATVVLEPLAQIALSPSTDLDPDIPNEDSIVVQLDETNLFRANKFSGFDLYEGGRRLNVGGRVTATWANGREVRALVGRSFRDEDDIFPASSGLRRTASDWVVAASAVLYPGVSGFTRLRLDGDDFSIRRSEAGVNLSRGPHFLGFRYLQDQVSQITGTRIENMDAVGRVFFSDHWGVTFMVQRDIERGLTTRRDVGLVYSDECVTLDIVYEHEDTQIGPLGGSDQFTVRLTLATLGGAGYSEDDSR